MYFRIGDMIFECHVCHEYVSLPLELNRSRIDAIASESLDKTLSDISSLADGKIGIEQI